MALSRTVIGIYSKLNAGTPAFTTEEFTPPANSLLVVRVYLMRKEGESEIGTPAVSGGGLVWTNRGANTTLKPAWSTKAVWFTAPVGGSPAKMAVTVDDANNLNIYEYIVSVIAYTGYDTTTPIGGIVSSGATNIGDGEESRELSEAPGVADETLVCIDVDATKAPPAPSLETGWAIVHEKSASGESGIAVASRGASTSKVVKVKDVYVGGGTLFKAGLGAMVVRAAAGAKVVEVGRATDTSTARAISSAKTLQVVRAAEVDVARPIAAVKVAAVLRATEVDSARPLASAKGKLVDRAAEVDFAHAIAAVKTTTVDRASEADLARALMETKAAAVGRASEGDLARPLSSLKVAALARATEIDVARGLSVGRAFTLNRAVEVDQARSVGSRKALALGRAVEVDQARAIELLHGLEVARAVEADAAGGISKAKVAQIARAVEIDVATVVRPLKLVAVLPAIEVDSAASIETPLPPTPALARPLGAICLSAESTGAVLVELAERGALCLSAEPTAAIAVVVTENGAVAIVPEQAGALSLGAESTGALQLVRVRGARLL